MDVEAQSDLGHRHLTGDGVKEDAIEATLWLRRAAQQGHLGAQHTLAQCYRSGRGVAQDLAAWRGWLEVAAAAGFVPSRQELAQAHESGEHLPRVLEEGPRGSQPFGSELRKTSESDGALMARLSEAHRELLSGKAQPASQLIEELGSHTPMGASVREEAAWFHLRAVALHRLWREHARAEPLYARARALLQLHDPNGPALPQVIEAQAHIAWRTDRFDDAKALALRSRELYAARGGQSESERAGLVSLLGAIAVCQGLPDEGETLYGQAINLWQTGPGLIHAPVSWATEDLSTSYTYVGDSERALVHLRRLVVLLTLIHGETDDLTLDVCGTLVGRLFLTERFGEAEPVLRRLLDHYQRAGGPQDNIAQFTRFLARAAAKLGRSEEASSLYQASCQAWAQTSEDFADIYAETLDEWGQLLIEAGTDP